MVRTANTERGAALQRNQHFNMHGSSRAGARAVQPQNNLDQRGDAEKRRSRRSSMSLRTVIFMLLVIAAMTALLLYYIKLQADVTRTSQEIADLEQQLTQMKAENDADYNEINDSISLEEVRDRAIHELGMKYADRDQVIIYSGSEDDAVHQVSGTEDN